MVDTVTKVRLAAQRAGAAVLSRLSTLNAPSALKVMDSVQVAQVTMVPHAARPDGSVCPKVDTIRGASLQMDALMWSTSNVVDQSSRERSAAPQVMSAEPPTSTTQIAELVKLDPSSSAAAKVGRDRTSQLAACMALCAQLKTNTTLSVSLPRPRTC